MFIEFIKRLNKLANHLWLFFLDLIFPIECLGCGQEGRWLCPDCFKEVKFKPKQYCLHCKLENDFGQFCPPPARPQPDKVIRPDECSFGRVLAGNGRSGGCQVLYDLDGVWIAALYEDKLIRQIIKDLKYYFVSSLAAVLGKLLILFINNLINKHKVLGHNLREGINWPDFNQIKSVPLAILDFKADLVMAVPLSAKRRRWRGFNQAEILAEIFAKEYDLEINLRDLVRIKHKTAQAKLNEASRLENIKDCFAWRGGNLNKRNIILIDDVVTTGATLNECAKILKASGAGEVWGLVAAKG